MNTHVTVSNIHRDVANINTLVSDVHHGVLNTHAIVYDIHQNILRSQKGANGQHLLVSVTRTPSPDTDSPLAVGQTQDRSAASATVGSSV